MKMDEKWITLTDAGYWVGNPAYSAPEQMEAVRIGETDEWISEPVLYVAPCDNCGHCHLDDDWIPLAEGVCVPK